MFGLSWLTIPVLLGLFTFLVGVLRWIYTTFFSKNAKAEALLLWAERKKAEYKVERDRLQATYTRIQKEPPRTGQDVVDELNEKFPGR